MSKSAARLLFCGDVCGNMNALWKKVMAVNESNGPFDAVFCVGQFLPQDAKGVEEMEEFVAGKKQKVLPVPTYFIGDYGEGAAILLSDARAEAAKVGFAASDGIRVCHNLFWLRGSGILRLKDVKIAFLGGRFDEALYGDAKAAAAAGAYHEDDVDALRAVAEDPGIVDVFLTNEWGTGILAGANLSTVPDELIKAAAPGGTSVVGELAAELKPRYHIAGSAGVFYAREPYMNPGVSHVTRFIGLGGFGGGSKRGKCVHALALTPACGMSCAELGGYATPSPYDVEARVGDGGSVDSRKADSGEGQYWRYSDSKRQKRGDASGSGERVCFEFVSKGTCSRGGSCHFKHDIDGTPIPRGSCFDFIIKGSCQKGGECRYRHSLEDPRKPTEPCWFCLSNAAVDAHLVISVGDHCYCALAKGPLVPDHVLILPIDHFPSLLSLPLHTHKEIARYKEALRQCFNSQNKAVVMFERYLQLRAGTHAHLQVVPIPLLKAGQVQKAFESAGQNLGLDFKLFPPSSSNTPQQLTQLIAAGVNYFTVELPDGTILARPLASNDKIPMQFGREVLAQLLDTPHRADWKACQLTKQQEIDMVEAFKEQFHNFDPDED